MVGPPWQRGCCVWRYGSVPIGTSQDKNMPIGTKDNLTVRTGAEPLGSKPAVYFFLRGGVYGVVRPDGTGLGNAER